MNTDGLDEINIANTSTSFEPNRENEGINSIRLALIKNVSQPVDSDRHDSSLENRQAYFGGLLEEVGLNPDLARHSTDQSTVEQSLDEAQSIIELPIDQWNSNEARSATIVRLSSESQPRYRLSSLATGLCSSNERESAVGAASILNSIQVPIKGTTTGWDGWPFRYVDRKIDLYRVAGQDIDQIPSGEGGFDNERFLTGLEWEGGSWATYANYWLNDAKRSRRPEIVLAALRFISRIRIDLALKSNDFITRELASSTLPQAGAATRSTPNPSFAYKQANASKHHAGLSTMVHGTAAFRGDWWFPGGTFFRYIKTGHPVMLYEGGQEFSWSGAYRDTDREVAGNRFKRWAKAVSGDLGLDTVFAHSYGSEVVARSINLGASIDKVVYMSAPVNTHLLNTLSRVQGIVNIRLKFDLVLLLDRVIHAYYPLPREKNVKNITLGRNYWSHSATHSDAVWKRENICI